MFQLFGRVCFLCQSISRKSNCLLRFLPSPLSPRHSFQLLLSSSTHQISVQRDCWQLCSANSVSLSFARKEEEETKHQDWVWKHCQSSLESPFPELLKLSRYKGLCLFISTKVWNSHLSWNLIQRVRRLELHSTPQGDDNMLILNQ